VALGAGISLYFGLPNEPPLWAGPAVLAASLGAGLALRRRPAAVVALLIAVGTIAFGFTAASLRSWSKAGPVIADPTEPMRVSGRVSELEPLENGQRVVLDRLSLPGLVGGTVPRRVRLHLRSGIDVRPGQHLSVLAVLMPPPPPAAPGAYDFSRQAWFLGLGASVMPSGSPV